MKHLLVSLLLVLSGPLFAQGSGVTPEDIEQFKSYCKNGCIVMNQEQAGALSQEIERRLARAEQEGIKKGVEMVKSNPQMCPRGVGDWPRKKS